MLDFQPAMMTEPRMPRKCCIVATSRFAEECKYHMPSPGGLVGAFSYNGGAIRETLRCCKLQKKSNSCSPNSGLGSFQMLQVTMETQFPTPSSGFGNSQMLQATMEIQFLQSNCYQLLCKASLTKLWFGVFWSSGPPGLLFPKKMPPTSLLKSFLYCGKQFCTARGFSVLWEPVL